MFGPEWERNASWDAVVPVLVGGGIGMRFSFSGQRRDDASRGGDEPERDAGHTGRWVLDDPGWWPSFKLGL